MYLTYAGIVTRRNRDQDHFGYLLDQWDFQAWSSDPSEQHIIDDLAHSSCHFYVGRRDLNRAFRGDDLDEVRSAFPDFSRSGGVMISINSPIARDISVYISIGESEDFPVELEESLRSEHLGIHVNLDVGLSLVENNTLMKRPVTFSELKNGREFISVGVPEFSLIRRHVP